MDNGGHDDSWNGAHWKGEYHHPPVSAEEIRWHDAVPTDWPLPSEPIIGREHRRTPSFQVCTSEFRESLLSEESHHGQKKPRRQKGSSHSSPLRWTPEILSLMLGIVAIVVILVVLVRADGNPPPNWPLGLTLNTFVAFFTSLARVSFMFPVVEGLGQLKWMWFTSPQARPLADFALFDDASRGAFGSLRLLVRLKGYLGCLAAVITLSGFLTSTITQQAIVYPVLQAERDNGTATVARATTFSLYNGSNLDIALYETTREKLALVRGAYAVPTEIVAPVSPVCSTGECEWLQYGSLAICSDVANLTAMGNATLLGQLRKLVQPRLESIFNSTSTMVAALGYPIPGVPPSFPIVLGATPGPTGAFNDSVTQLLFTDNYIAYTNAVHPNASDIRPEELLFLEVGFYWCTKTLSTQVHNGVSYTEEVDAAAVMTRNTTQSLNFGWNTNFYLCYVAGDCNATLGGLQVELQSPPGVAAERYVIDVWTSLMSSALVFASMYDVALIDGMHGLVAASGGGLGQAFVASILGDFMATTLPAPEEQLVGVRNVSRNIAQSLTNLLREGDTNVRLSPNTTIVNGTAYAPQTFVAVHWGYISMLLAQLGLVTLFFAMTVAQTYIARMHVLKGCPLATMCALDRDTRTALGDVDEGAKFRARAEGLRVRLVRGQGIDGAGLWLKREWR